MESHIPGYGYLEIKSDKPEFIKVEDWRPFEAKGGKPSNYKRRKTHKKLRRRVKKSRKHIRK
jgi:hypothetical protein